MTLQRLQTLESPQDISTNFRSLVFSPDSHILSTVSKRVSTQLFVVSWDLQTGGVTSAVMWQGRDDDSIAREPSMTYSANGKMIGVHFCYSGDDANVILIFDVSSGVCMYSHLLTGTIYPTNSIWAHGESFRFETIHEETITISEVGFTSDSVPTVVDTLPPMGGASGEFYHRNPSNHHSSIRVHPAPCRLAYAFQGSAMVWDVQNSKYLLNCTDTTFYSTVSFSSDGRFFACSTTKSDVYLWKESPTGYMLHNILASSTVHSHPLLSPNGESIVAFGGPTIRLWRTKGFTTPLSSVSARTRQHTEDFVLDFSPDGMFAAFAMLKDKTVTVLNLKPSVRQLTIDASMEVYGLRVVWNAITVIGVKKIVTWDLPAGDRVPDAKMTLADSAWTRNLGATSSGSEIGASISPDSCHIVIISVPVLWGTYLDIYDGSTGGLVREMGLEEGQRPWFAPGGCNLWVVDDDGEGRMIEVGCSRQVLQDPDRGVDIECPPEGYPWKSSLGYQVTTDWWILGPDGKRLLMLPPPWQSPKAVLRIWKGQFLALLHCGLSEPVILELEP